jgi:peptidoglycan/xylan/chitin deacetylase (PgdA/CDA1 family)
MSKSWKIVASIVALALLGSLAPLSAAGQAAAEGGAMSQGGQGLDVRRLEGGIVRGPTSSRRLAIIFTGHGYAEGGETILNELGSHKAKASFFFTGDFLTNSSFKPLIQRVVWDGHYLGPHSDKHLLYCPWEGPKKTLVTHAEFKSDLESNLQKIERFGVQRAQIRYFLPPYEHYNEEIAGWAKAMGLTLVNCTPGTRSNADYTGETDKNFVSTKAIFESIVLKEQQDPTGLNGFLLLLHIGSGPGRADKFPARLGELLDYLAGKGYQFVRVDELLEPEQIFIRANQLGYRPGDAKIAIAFSVSRMPDSFTVVGVDTGTAVFQGRARPVTGLKWGQFENHVELDFSSLKTPGRYELRVGESTSLPFTIRAAVYDELPGQLMEFMREQRCGYNPWLDAYCHQLDGRTAYGPLTNGTYLDARGGWHDAADLLKYLLTSGNATAQMLLAYELGSAKSEVRSPKSRARLGTAAPVLWRVIDLTR